MYKLVPIDKIPLAGDVSLDQINEAYKIAVGLSILCVKEQGIGISAVQVGIPKKIFVVKNDIFTENYMTGFAHYVNCSYEPIGDEVYESLEGCLSLKNKNGDFRYFIVNRPHAIRLVGKKIIAGNPLRFEDVDVTIGKDNGAAVFAHETDHSFGKTIDKLGTEIVNVRKGK